MKISRQAAKDAKLFPLSFLGVFAPLREIDFQGRMLIMLSPETITRKEQQQQIVARIDAIIHELEELRRELTSSTQLDSTETPGIVEALFGAAGQGAREEYDDILGIWGRFEQ